VKNQILYCSKSRIVRNYGWIFLACPIFLVKFIISRLFLSVSPFLYNEIAHDHYEQEDVANNTKYHYSIKIIIIINFLRKRFDYMPNSMKVHIYITRKTLSFSSSIQPLLLSEVFANLVWRSYQSAWPIFKSKLFFRDYVFLFHDRSAKHTLILWQSYHFLTFLHVKSKTAFIQSVGLLFWSFSAVVSITKYFFFRFVDQPLRYSMICSIVTSDCMLYSDYFVFIFFQSLFSRQKAFDSQSTSKVPLLFHFSLKFFILFAKKLIFIGQESSFLYSLTWSLIKEQFLCSQYYST